MRNLIIAIDGPAGAGKSTISRLISKKLGINYIDTGAMYRALTLKCISEGVDISQTDKVIELCKNVEIDFIDNSIYLDGENVDNKIRSSEINLNVSNVAKIKEVREMMVKKQREIGMRSDVILDGRDVGTHIFPNTKFKFFLNASPEERGRRRYEEIKDKEKNITLKEIISGIKRRDDIDSSREVSPLVKAGDAHEIDSTNMSIEEVVDYIVNEVKINSKIGD
ncbi:(d)CMP kinase [Peptostreptococcus faecalis]|uniref:(d)CMP kinase n=1 Tax=Peptostreptococcus faecalis TaxID=2045015 RepID=UPI000C7B41FF|nr:(d)CMP kinase [Peptostreptococcus faecalis]